MAVLKSYPLQALSNHATDARSGQTFKALCAVYPDRISAKHLMERVGLAWQREPTLSFVSLCNDFLKINRDLAPYGWQAKRSGTTADADYWLSPIKAAAN